MGAGEGSSRRYKYGLRIDQDDNNDVIWRRWPFNPFTACSSRILRPLTSCSLGHRTRWSLINQEVSPTCRPAGRSREESVPTGFFSSKRVGQEKVRDESYYKEVISPISHEWLLRQPCAAFRNLISPATRTLYYAYALRSGTTLTSALACKVVSEKDHNRVECFEILISPTTRLWFMI